MSYIIAFHYSGTPAVELEFSSYKEVYAYLVDLNRQLDESMPSWYDISLLDSTPATPARIVSYDHRTNEEYQNSPTAYMALPAYLRNAWTRLQRHLMKNRAFVYAAQFMLHAYEDQDHGGHLTEQDLLDAGFSKGTTKTHPGYWPRTETPLTDCLELYNGAFGVGLKEHYARFDTKNYHYVRYWLLDLEENEYGQES